MDEAGETTQVVAFRPANCALSGLICGCPAHAFIALHASTKLDCPLFRRHATDVGIVGYVHVPHVHAQTLEARKPEELVLDNRSARRRAELLQGRRGDPRIVPGEVVGRIRGAASRPKA